jgi:hypothetical protein
MRLSPRRYSSRPWGLLLVVVRALTLLLALQFSGTLHDLTDVVDAFSSESSGEHEQCPVDGPCQDCPPGCPNCHCASLGSLAPEPPPELVPQLLVSSLPLGLYATQAIPGPERPSLFRPPRA